MLAGVMFVIAGILIAVYPPLLSLIVAGLLLMTGSSMIAFSYFNRKLQRRSENPVVEFFFRY